MFFLDGRRKKTDGNSSCSDDGPYENNGWLIDSAEDTNSHRSLGSTTSMMTYVDTEEDSNNAYPNVESCDESEKIELKIFRCGKNMMLEKMGYSNEEELIQGICYEPERLIKSRNYRIMLPPRRTNLEPFEMIEREFSKKRRQSLKGTNYSFESRRLDSPTTNVRTDSTLSHIKNDKTNSFDSCNRLKSVGSDKSTAPDFHDSSTSRDCGGETLAFDITGDFSRTSASSLLEDSSGIQSNISSFDEFTGNSSTSITRLTHPISESTFINKLGLSYENESEIKKILLAESPSASRVARIALAIETDDESGNYSYTEHPVRELCNKVEKLQLNSTDLHRDVRSLRKHFEVDDLKLTRILSDCTRLREDIRQKRYYDDLLNLLDGELETISKRNWPFLIGREENSNEEMNLIV